VVVLAHLGCVNPGEGTIMYGESHWFTPVMLLIVGGGIVALWRFMLGVERSLRAVEMNLSCPVSGQKVSAVAVQNKQTGFYTGIRSCSAFAGGELDCSRSCVPGLNRQPVARTAQG
jgi:hypothetical protein